jgi:predicted O-methyltransferase YrrM
MTTSESVRSAFKYLFKAELKELKKLAKELPPNPVVINIGAGSGTSGLAFMESRPDITLVTIDITDESSPFGCLAAERDVIVKAGYPNSMQQIWRQIHGDSKTVDYTGVVDMVFIDGDHSYEGCIGDIKVWLTRLRWGGVMAIHDYEKQKRFNDQFVDDAPHYRAWPGVDAAVQEFAVWGKYDEFYVVDTLAVFKGVYPF